MAALPTDEQIAVLREQGFVVARGFADAGRVAALRALSERHLQDHVAPIEYEADLRYPGAPESRQAEGGQTVRRLLSAYGRDPLYAQWATDPAIGQWLARYFGETPVLSTVHHNCVMTKHPAYGSLTGWHQDIRYWSFSDTDLVSCWLALGHEARANGGLSFIPGSHAAAFQPAQFDAKKFFRDDEPLNAPWIARAVCRTWSRATWCSSTVARCTPPRATAATASSCRWSTPIIRNPVTRCPARARPASRACRWRAEPGLSRAGPVATAAAPTAQWRPR